MVDFCELMVYYSICKPSIPLKDTFVQQIGDEN